MNTSEYGGNVTFSYELPSCQNVTFSYARRVHNMSKLQIYELITRTEITCEIVTFSYELITCQNVTFSYEFITYRKVTLEVVVGVTVKERTSKA